jgi:hypothetical protein
VLTLSIAQDVSCLPTKKHWRSSSKPHNPAQSSETSLSKQGEKVAEDWLTCNAYNARIYVSLKFCSLWYVLNYLRICVK